MLNVEQPNCRIWKNSQEIVEIVSCLQKTAVLLGHILSKTMTNDTL